MNSTRNKGNEKFWSPKTALTKSMKFTRFIIYLLLKVIK